MTVTELMQVFGNPETIKSLSAGDKMMGVGVTVVLGMGITFVALVFLQFLIGFMTKILAEKPKAEAPAPAASTPTVSKSDADDEELMAAITAAVAAKMGVSPKNIIRTAVKLKAV